MNIDRKVIEQALEAIEQGWSFDRIDNEIGPMLRSALMRDGNRTVTYVCPVCAASLERQE